VLAAAGRPTAAFFSGGGPQAAAGRDSPLLASWAGATGVGLDMLTDLAQRCKSGTPEWFMPYRQAEAEATTIRSWAPMVVPGLAVCVLCVCCVCVCGDEHGRMGRSRHRHPGNYGYSVPDYGPGRRDHQRARPGGQRHAGV
jgi:hypothetical protein